MINRNTNFIISYTSVNCNTPFDRIDKPKSERINWGLAVSPRPIAGARRELGPASAGASLVDNKPSKLFSRKPNGLKSFEGSLRGTFQKVPLEEKNTPINQNLNLRRRAKAKERIEKQ